MRTTIGAAKRFAVRQRIEPQSFSCSAAGSAYLRNWISGTGMSPAAAMPTARPMMPSSDRLVSNTRATPNFSCSPRVAACTPPLRPTSSPNTTTRGFTSSSCSSVRRTAVTQVDARHLAACRLLRAARGQDAVRPQAALRLNLDGAVLRGLREHVTAHARGIRRAALLDALARLSRPPRAHAPPRRPRPRRRAPRARAARVACATDRAPARPRSPRTLVRLGVLARVTRQPRHREPQQRRDPCPHARRRPPRA